MTRAKVCRRSGSLFVLDSGEFAQLPVGADDYPLIDDEVDVEGGVIVRVHHTRTAFGYESREEFTR